ncbi:MAG TPA: multicopper oxidase domain-containing protein [Euzebyales bacterium]
MAEDRFEVNWPAFLAIGIGALALFLSIFALGRALASPLDEQRLSDAPPISDDAGNIGVELDEFAIQPAEVEVVSGSTVGVTNTGGIPHNIEVVDTDVATGDLNAGESVDLDVSGLDPGTYTWICSIEGHEAAGMTGTLTLVGDEGAAEQPDGEGSAAGDGAAAQAMVSAAEMEQAMADSIGAFPAETEGEGGAALEPDVQSDGTKLFELTVDETEWEVEPGKVVDAIAYNGVVPGPTMKVDVGDRVTIRVHNELDDTGTSLHPHGLKDHDFEIDGVTFISQDPIAPGDSMSYTFVADQESVMTYHSHHMSLEQVPNGLFGTMIVGDYADSAGVNGVVDEQVMILNDAGNVGLTLNGKSFPATTPYAYKAGDKVLVHYANEGQMAHPMHLHNQPGTVIAKDGYMLPRGARYTGDTFNIAPGERLSVVYEMKTPGTWVWHCHILSHVKRTDGTMFGMLTAVIIDE